MAKSKTSTFLQDMHAKMHGNHVYLFPKGALSFLLPQADNSEFFRINSVYVFLQTLW